VIGERPVTGSCERCRQDHDLLIPEPGLGDLHLERIAERFGWCAGCDRLVGQRCCWVADAALCADCSTDLTTPGSSLTDASLTSNALNAIAAAASSLAAAEARLGELPVRDEDRARNAWEDAWLEVGTLAVKTDSAARAVRRRASDSDDAADRFAALATTWKARGGAMDDRLRDVGRQIQALKVVAASRAGGSNGGTADARSQPVAERGSVTTLARPRTVSSRDVIVSPPPSREPRTNPSDGGPPRRAASSGSAAPRGASAAVMSAPAPTPAGPAAPIANPVPETAQIWPSEPLHELELVPVPMAAPVAEASSMPEAEPVPGPTNATAGRRRQRFAGATVVALALIGAGVVVATIQRQVVGLGSRADPSAESAAGDLPSRAGGEGASTSVVPASSAIPPPLSAPAVSFDLEPLGPLPSDAEGVALVLGAPEVAALPTSFDRSLRLGAAGDGVCLAGLPGGSAARALTVDVLVGAQLTTDLVITPAHRVEETVTVALDEFPGLAAGTWYRLHVAWDEGGEISLEVNERDAGGAVQRAALQPSTPPDRSAMGSICIEAGRATEEAAVHLDNIRVGA
jgi:hypothetical protein